jgi:hypothetical protein
MSEEKQRLTLPPYALWAMVGILALISFRGDGTFPFPKTTPANILLFVQTTQTLLLVALWAGVLLTGRGPGRWLERRLRLPQMGCRTVAVTAAFFTAWTFAVHYFQARHYAGYGYGWDLRDFGILFGAGASGYLILASRRVSIDTLFFYTVGTSALFRLLPIAYFPLSPLRSDMLPKIALAAQRLLEGIQPYGFLKLGPSKSAFMNYLPGTWLPYVPFVKFGLDVRFVTFAALYTSVILIWLWTKKGGSPSRLNTISILLIVFLTTPYLHYRHEIYSPVQWLTTVLLILAVSGESCLLAGAAGGLAVATVQWNWLLMVFIAIHCRARWKAGELAKAALLCLGVAASLIVPFTLWGPGEFYSSAIAVYSNLAKNPDIPYPNMIGFTSLIYAAGIGGWISLLQGGFVLGTIAVGWREFSNLSETLRWATVALLCVMLINIFVWTYFFLHLYLITVLFLAARFKGPKEG